MLAMIERYETLPYQARVLRLLSVLVVLTVAFCLTVR
jgi:hypothetical protein